MKDVGSRRPDGINDWEINTPLVISFINLGFNFLACHKNHRGRKIKTCKISSLRDKILIIIQKSVTDFWSTLKKKYYLVFFLWCWNSRFRNPDADIRFLIIEICREVIWRDWGCEEDYKAHPVPGLLCPTIIMKKKAGNRQVQSSGALIPLLPVCVRKKRI